MGSREFWPTFTLALGKPTTQQARIRTELYCHLLLGCGCDDTTSAARRRMHDDGGCDDDVSASVYRRKSTGSQALRPQSLFQKGHAYLHFLCSSGIHTIYRSPKSVSRLYVWPFVSMFGPAGTGTKLYCSWLLPPRDLRHHRP